MHVPWLVLMMHGASPLLILRKNAGLACVAAVLAIVAIVLAICSTVEFAREVIEG